MHPEYLKESKVIEKTAEQKKRELLVSIRKRKRELDAENRNFEYAESELIDYYTYQIKAMRSKLDYLVKKAKKNGIALDMISEIEIRLNEA